MKACPFCGEMIQDAAVRCRFCQKDLNAPPGVGRSGNLLVADKGQDLPRRCVKCNAQPVKKTIAQTYGWHHPALYALILAGVIIYLIAALAVRKTIKLNVGLCEEHARKRGRNMAIGWGMFLLSIVFMIVSGAAEFWAGFALSWLLLLTGLIWAAFAMPVLKPQKIDENTAWLKSAGKAFLDSLPERS
jgi:hypothetical protein